MTDPYLVKGIPVVTLPSHGNGGEFNKVPKSPSGRPRDLKIPAIITRLPIGRKCSRCRMRPCRCQRRRA